MFVKINKTKNMYDLKKEFLRRLQLPEALLKTKKKIKNIFEEEIFFSHFAKKEKNLLCPINDYTYFL
jgi:hypothetical protein